MALFAELADGRKLEFPDGTDPSVVQATVKKNTRVYSRFTRSRKTEVSESEARIS